MREAGIAGASAAAVATLVGIWTQVSGGLIRALGGAGTQQLGDVQKEAARRSAERQR